MIPTTVFKNFFVTHRWTLGLLLLGAFIQYQGLFDASLNWDEAETLAIAQLPFQELFHVLSIRDFHPAAFHTLLHGWIQIWGNSDISIRMLSWLFGVLVS